MGKEHPGFVTLSVRATSFLFNELRPADGPVFNKIRKRARKGVVFVEGESVFGLQPHSPSAKALELELLAPLKPDDISPQGVSIVEVYRDLIENTVPVFDFGVSVTQGRGRQAGKTYTRISAYAEEDNKES